MSDCGCGLKFAGGGSLATPTKGGGRKRRMTRKGSKKSRKQTRRVRKH